MKKYNLLKILGILFLVTVLLTWIIPIGTYDEARRSVIIDAIRPLGIFDLFYVPLYSLIAYAEYAVVILVIGALYGVLHKTGAYNALVEKSSKLLKNKKTYLVISILFFSVASSLFGLTFPLMMLCPFVISIILALGYDKLTAFAATFGSILVGMIGTTFGLIQMIYKDSIISINLFERMSSGILDKIYIRLILYAIVVFLYAVLVTYRAKKERKDKIKEEIKEKVVKKEKNNNIIPLVICMVLLFVVSIFTMYNWDYIFSKSVFSNFDSTISSTVLGENLALKSVLGNSLVQVGTFANLQFIAIIFIFIILISFVYSLKFDEVVDGIIEGAKKALKVAVYVILANIVMMVVNNFSSGSFIVTIENFISGLFGKFNVITTTLFSLVGGLFYNSLYDFAVDTSIITHFIASNELEFSVFALNLQAVFNTLMMILPTSMVLVAGLSYLDIDYKEWIKYIWKYILEIFIIIMILCQITYMLF